MTTIGKLNYQIGANTDGFTSGMVATRKELRDAKRVMRETQTPAERLGRKVDDLNGLFRKGLVSREQYNARMRQFRLEKMRSIPVVGRFAAGIAGMHPATMAAGVGIGALTVGIVAAKKAVDALTRAVQTQLQEIDKIAKDARSIGIATEQLVGLRLAASEFSGMSDATLDKSLQRMTVRIGEAAGGTGQAKAALESLGLSASSLARETPDEAFRQIADAISGVEDPTMQAAAAYAIFGRQGVELLNTLRAGREGLDEKQAAAEALGKTFTELEAQQVEDANDALGRAGDTLTGLARELTIELAPSIKMLADAFVELTDKNSQFGQTVRTGISLMGPGLASAADAANGLLGVLQISQAEILQMLATLLTGIETADRVLAAVTGRAANEDLAVMADSFRQSADALAAEGAERVSSGFGGEMTAELMAAKDAWTGVTDAQRDSAMMTTEQLEALAEQAQAIEEVNASAAGLADQYEMSALTLGMSSREAEILKLEMAGANAETIALARSLDQALTAAENAQALQESIDGVTAKLLEQVQTLGMSSTEAELWRLEQDGATQSQLAMARSLADQLDQMTEYNSLMDEGAKLTESLRTPQEKVSDELDHLAELYGLGAIDLGTYQRAIQEVRDELAPPITASVDVLGVDAAVAGSQQAAKAIARFRAETATNEIGAVRLADARAAGAAAAEGGQQALQIAAQQDSVEQSRHTRLLDRIANTLEMIEQKTPDDPETIEVDNVSLS